VIFVTVGEQLSFDRLIKTVDDWAKDAGQEVVAQIGKTTFIPRHLQHQQSYPPHRYRQLYESADLVIAHAGIGTIINAVELSKPLLIMPRRHEFGEHRNDHQLATAHRFAHLSIISVAWDENELTGYLTDLKSLIGKRESAGNVGADPRLIKKIKNFVNSYVDEE